MEEATREKVGRRQSRGFILGSLAVGHGGTHLFEFGFPFILTEIAASLGLGTIQKASLFAVKQAGFGVVNLGAGPFVDKLKRQWGLILTGCMVWACIAHGLMGASPNYVILIMPVMLMSIPGSLWHLPSAATVSQRFPDRRGFAISIHGLGGNVGNIIGPLLAGALLGALLWRNVLFIFAGIALVLATLALWSLKEVGREGGQEDQGKPGFDYWGTWSIIKNPVILVLMLAALLRGVAIIDLLNWTPFYLTEVEKNGLGMGSLEAGFHNALLVGAGVVAAPVLGALSDRYGRKTVLVPGLGASAALSMLIVSAGDSILLPVVLAAMGLFTFSLIQIMQAMVLDLSGIGTEATTMGLFFGLSGIIGTVTPFMAFVIIDHLGGYGSIYYYAGILTALAALFIIIAPLPKPMKPALTEE